jgi:hypothetical protein
MRHQASLMSWVKTGKVQREQMSSALPLKPDIAEYGWHVRFVARLCKKRMFEVGRRSQLPSEPILCSDRFHQSANAQNAHHAFHVVGQDVQRHFGTYVLERFHLEVRRSHPRLYRAEWMLDRLPAYAHLVRVPIEPRLHRLKDSFVLPA